jgi:hypothetical protein
MRATISARSISARSIPMPAMLAMLGCVVAMLGCVGPTPIDDTSSTAQTLGEDTVETLDTSDSGDGDAEGCQSDAECAGNPAGPVCDEADGQCYPECEPGDADECYDGTPVTLDVGACHAGSYTCSSLGTWGTCTGQTVPGEEICDNDIDEDCDGSLVAVDQDGDGWSTCDNDCCDDEIIGCIDAAFVNPGAFEVEGNEVDDDCDGMIDEATPSCDSDLESDSDTPLDYAAAIDLCQTTEEDAPLPERTWGVISAELTLADGDATPLPVQRSIRPGFGYEIVPSGGESLVVLSSGRAAASDQTSPTFAPFESGQNLGTSVIAPADWLLANGNKFPNSCDVPDNPNLPPPGIDANDSAMLKLRVRVPTNARSFSTRIFFFSAEYAEWVCSSYNDFFITLIDSAGEGNPSDKNIAVYDDGETLWPVGLNILTVAPGLFSVCQSGYVGCQAGLQDVWHECAAGPELLAGTGFDNLDTGESCNGDNFPVGGATGWLEMSGNVEPGETMEIRFALWDSGGHLFDALVLLDDWRWSLDAASPGVSTP